MTGQSRSRVAPTSDRTTWDVWGRPNSSASGFQLALALCGPGWLSSPRGVGREYTSIDTGLLVPDVTCGTALCRQYKAASGTRHLDDKSTTWALTRRVTDGCAYASPQAPSGERMLLLDIKSPQPRAFHCFYLLFRQLPVVRRPGGGWSSTTSIGRHYHSRQAGGRFRVRDVGAGLVDAPDGGFRGDTAPYRMRLF